MFKKLKNVRKCQNEKSMKLENFLRETDELNKNIRRENIKLLFQDTYLRGKSGLDIDLDHITNIVEKM